MCSLKISAFTSLFLKFMDFLNLAGKKRFARLSDPTVLYMYDKKILDWLMYTLDLDKWDSVSFLPSFSSHDLKREMDNIMVLCVCRHNIMGKKLNRNSWMKSLNKLNYARVATLNHLCWLCFLTYDSLCFPYHIHWTFSICQLSLQVWSACAFRYIREVACREVLEWTT